MPIRLAVFDIAGTTVSDQHFVGKALYRAFRKNGYEVSMSSIQPLMGYKKSFAIKQLLVLLNVDPTYELVGDIHQDFVEEMKEFYQTSTEVAPLPGAEEIFSLMKKNGIRIALNTGFPKEIADTIMQRFKWIEKGLVDDYIASDQVEAGRPHPYMIHELMFRAKVVDPKEVMKVGDTEVDIAEGRNAGCGLVVSISTGAFTRERLNTYNPDLVIDSLTELSPLIS